MSNPDSVILSLGKILDEISILNKSVQEKDSKIKELTEQLELYKSSSSKSESKEITLFVSKDDNHFTLRKPYIRDSHFKLSPILHEASFPPVVFENEDEEIYIIRSDGINIKICTLDLDKISKLYKINYDESYDISNQKLDRIIANKNIMLARVEENHGWWTLVIPPCEDEFNTLRETRQLSPKSDIFLAPERSEDDKNILIEVSKEKKGKRDITFYHLIDKSETSNFELELKEMFAERRVKEIIPCYRGVAYIDLDSVCWYIGSEYKLVVKGAEKIFYDGDKLQVTLQNKEVISYDPRD